MAEEQAKEIVTQEPPEAEQTEAKSEVKPLTQEEVKAMIAAEVDKVKAEEQAKYQSLQRVIAKKDTQIQELRKPVKTDNSDIDLLETTLKAVKGSGDETEIKVAEAALTEAKRKRAFNDRMREQQEIVDRKETEFKSKIEAIGLDPEDPKFDSFWDAFENAKAVTGNFSIAETRLNRVLKTVPEKKLEVKTETPKTVDNLEKMKEEIRRQVMEEHGLLASDAGVPSAANKKKDEGYAKFSRGEITREQAAKQYGVNFS